MKSVYGPAVPVPRTAIAVADFNGDGHPDYLLYNASTRQTGIWNLNNDDYIRAAYGPTLSAVLSLVAP